MKKITARKFLALVLALAMTAACSLSALAETQVLEGDQDEGITVHAFIGGEKEVVVNGSVKDEESAPDGGSVGIYVVAEHNGTATATVKGDVESTTEYNTAIGIEAYPMTDGEVVANVDGSVEAKAAPGASAIGEYIVAEGGSAEITTGDLTVTTEGGENGMANGIEVILESDWEQTDLSKKDFDELGLDPVDRIQEFEENPGSKDDPVTVNWVMEDGTNYNVSGYYEGGSFVGEHYWTNAPVHSESDIDITVDGDLHVVNMDGDATGIISHQSGDVSGSELDVTVTGDVTVEAEAGDAAGIDVFSYQNATDFDVTVQGDLTVKSEGGYSAEGIDILAGNDTDGDVTVDGKLTVIMQEGESAGLKGIAARAEDGGDIAVTVGEGIEVSSEGEIDDVWASGISASTGILGANSIDIDVLDGGVTVDAGSGYGVSATNYSGEIDISITGDVVAPDTGIVLSSGGTGKIMTETGEIEEVTPESNTKITVDGDVKAGDTGVSIMLRNEKASMDVIVDGTISGEVSSVMLDEGTIAENVKLTVWEIKPNEDRSVAQTRSWGFDEETKRQTRIFEENKEFEKQIQYIIRVEQPDIGSVAAEGTFQYEGYDVAHEGDTVTLKVTVPDGYRLADAFNGTDTKVQLLKDTNGDFYLVVPRGGAVTLSVKLEKAASSGGEESPSSEEAPEIVVTPVDYTPEPAPEAEPEKLDDAQIATAVEELLTKNGVLENSVVEVETDESGAKTVVISPETIEAGEESTVLQLTVPAEMLTQLADSDVQQIRMVSQSGGATVSLDVAAVLEAAADKQGAKLVMNIEENSESVLSALKAVPAGFTGKAGAVTVTARIEDAEGNVTVLDSSANITLTLNVEYEEGMKILFVDADGNVSETKAVWIEAADGVPGHWEVPFLGEGTYLPVVADK